MSASLESQAVLSVNPRAGRLLAASPTEAQNCRQATILFGLPSHWMLECHIVFSDDHSPSSCLPFEAVSSGLAPSGLEHHLAEAERRLGAHAP